MLFFLLITQYRVFFVFGNTVLAITDVSKFILSHSKPICAQIMK